MRSRVIAAAETARVASIIALVVGVALSLLGVVLLAIAGSGKDVVR